MGWMRFVALSYFIFYLIVLINGGRRGIRMRQLLTHFSILIFIGFVFQMFFVGRIEGDAFLLFVWGAIAFMNYTFVKFLKRNSENQIPRP